MRSLEGSQTGVRSKKVNRRGLFRVPFTIERQWAAFAVFEYIVLAIVYPDVASYFDYMQFEWSILAAIYHPALCFVGFLLAGSVSKLFAKVLIISVTIPTLVLSAHASVSVDVLSVSILLQAYVNFIDRDWGYPALPTTYIDTSYKYLCIFPFLSILFLVYFRDLVSFQNLLDVYGNRASYIEFIQSRGNVYLTYAKLVAKVTLVYLSVIAIRNKKYVYLVITFSVLFYTVFSSKFILFIPVLVWVAPRIFNQLIYLYVVFGSVALIYFMTLGSEAHLYVVSVVRRVFFLPSQLNEIYFEMYNDLGAQMFRTTLLSPFFDTGMILAREANVYLVGDGDSNANTGIVGSGIIQFSYLGPFIYASIYVFLLNLNEGYGRNDRIAQSTLIIFILTATWISDFSPTLFLHGGLAFCLLMRFSNRSFRP